MTGNTELVDKRWIIEKYENTEAPIELTVEDFKQSIYVGDCKKCIIQIHNKFNGININNCKDVGIVFDVAISTCEIVNCKKVQVQCIEQVPIFQVDKCENVTLYISENCFKNPDTKIYTSKSNEVKIILPPASEDGDCVECPVPEMFVSHFDNNKMITQVKTSDM